MDGRATELEIVRRELDALAIARGLGGWRPADEAHYQDLCQMERLLLTGS
jgi:hypothetical protein